MKATLLGVTFLAVTGVGAAQFAPDVRRASITGNRGDNSSGKCTVEVEVDGVADVEVRGDRISVRTLQGQRSMVRRFECTSPMPFDPADFRFRGIDGRGEVNLQADPRNNNGFAVVRINDDKGGREGYTFDLEWAGGSSGALGSYGNDRYDPSYRNDPYYRNDPANRNDPYYRNDRNRRYEVDQYGYGEADRANDRSNRYTLNCASEGGRQVCRANTRGGVRIVREFGNAACREGSTWGYDRRGVWVDRGCAAEFEVGRR